MWTQIINPEGVSRPQAGALAPATMGRRYEPRRGERASIFILSPLQGSCGVAIRCRGFTPACGLSPRRGLTRAFLIFNFSFFISLSLLLSSCTVRKSGDVALEAAPLRYATNLTCERGEGYSVWTLRNPWDTTQVLHRYVLVPTTNPLPLSIIHSSSVKRRFAPSAPFSSINVPLRHAGGATAVHCGLLDELGVSSAIAGVCEQQYIDLPAVKEGLAAGTIADFGNGMNPNLERIMDTAPDALLLTPFEHSGGYGRVERLGIPIIECAEYMEVSPLARAEWIRFYGELFGVPERADSIFRAVETAYLTLKEKVTSASSVSSVPSVSSVSPRLLTEMLYGGQWFVPCGQSTMGIMFDDAGADYIFRDRPGSGSTALPFETVLDEAQDADIWLIKYNSPQPLTYDQLAADYQPYTRFRAFQQRHIFACDLAHNHFYEETPFHPERLLRDFIIILHPHLLPGQTTRYYRPLAD